MNATGCEVRFTQKAEVMFRWSELALPDEFLPWLELAEKISREMNKEHDLALLSDEKLVELAYGMNAIHLLFPDMDYPWFPPAFEDSSDEWHKADIAILGKLEKALELIGRALNTKPGRIYNAIGTTFDTQYTNMAAADFFEDSDTYVNWPWYRSGERNEELDHCVSEITKLEAAVAAAKRLCEARAAMSPKVTRTVRGSMVDVRGQHIPELLAKVYPGVSKGGTQGGRGLKGPLYTFDRLILAKVFGRHLGPSGVREARRKIKSRHQGK